MKPKQKNKFVLSADIVTVESEPVTPSYDSHMASLSLDKTNDLLAPSLEKENDKVDAPVLELVSDAVSTAVESSPVREHAPQVVSISPQHAEQPYYRDPPPPHEGGGGSFGHHSAPQQTPYPNGYPYHGQAVQATPSPAPQPQAPHYPHTMYAPTPQPSMPNHAPPPQSFQQQGQPYPFAPQPVPSSTGQLNDPAMMQNSFAHPQGVGSMPIGSPSSFAPPPVIPQDPKEMLSLKVSARIKKDFQIWCMINNKTMTEMLELYMEKVVKGNLNDF